MTTLNDISILIVSAVKDVNRLKEVYVCIREQYPTNEIVIVYDNINKKVLHDADPFLIQVPTDKRVYVSSGYNLAVKNSSKPYFVFLHDDTYPGPNFLENILPHLSDDVFCNFCQVEPPTFNNPDTIQKPVKDFGLANTQYKKDDFHWFCLEREKTLPYKTEPSIYGGFFMAGSKKSFESVGGFDEDYQPYFYEDSDLMLRLHLKGYKFILILDSVVYHVGSLTSRGTEESVFAHNTTEKIFIRKWKTTFEHFKIFCMLEGFNYTQPRVRIELLNCNDKALIDYIELFNDPKGLYTLRVDCNIITQADVDYIPQIPYIISETKPNNTYTLGNLVLTT